MKVPMIKDEIKLIIFRWDKLLKGLNVNDASETALALIASSAQKDIPRLLAEIKKLQDLLGKAKDTVDIKI